MISLPPGPLPRSAPSASKLMPTFPANSLLLSAPAFHRGWLAPSKLAQPALLHFSVLTTKPLQRIHSGDLNSLPTLASKPPSFSDELLFSYGCVYVHLSFTKILGQIRVIPKSYFLQPNSIQPQNFICSVNVGFLFTYCGNIGFLYNPINLH